MDRFKIVKFYFCFIIFCNVVNAKDFNFDIVNGEAAIIVIDNKFAGDIYVNEKRRYWSVVPGADNKKFIIVAAGYKNKASILVKNIYNVGMEENYIFNVIMGNYKKENIKILNKQMLNPDKKTKKRIDLEFKEAMQIYSNAKEQIQFSKPFILPINSSITSNFGNARVFNNEVQSYHSGVDFRAKIGTDIVASNDGIVRISKDRYYAGKSVVIEHGAGIFSQYYHLSDILVQNGQHVFRGQVIGRSGDTGRVSGPHLHFGIAIYGTSVNPLKFIDMLNKEFFNE